MDRGEYKESCEKDEYRCHEKHNLLGKEYQIYKALRQTMMNMIIRV